MEYCLIIKKRKERVIHEWKQLTGTQLVGMWLWSGCVMISFPQANTNYSFWGRGYLNTEIASVRLACGHFLD